MTRGAGVSILDPHFTIYCASSICPDPLPQALSRYRELTLIAGGPGVEIKDSNADTILALEVFVSESVPLTFGVSEVSSLFSCSGLLYCLTLPRATVL